MNWLYSFLSFLDRIEFAVWRFFDRLRCEDAGHPITWTDSFKRSGCDCGKVAR